MKQIFRSSSYDMKFDYILLGICYSSLVFKQKNWIQNPVIYISIKKVIMSSVLNSILTNNQVMCVISLFNSNFSYFLCKTVECAN